MNTTAHADQLHAHLRDARCCDALAPCDACQDTTAAYRAARRGTLPVVPAPRTTLAARLAAAKVTA